MEEITEDKLREKLDKHYGGPDASNRTLHRHRMVDSSDEVGSVHYSLSGPPPKGYAIYIPGSRQVSLYDHQGKRLRHMIETVVVDEDGEHVE